MGIKGFVKWIERYAPSGIHMINFESIANKKLGIDASLLMYRAELAIKGSGFEMRNDKGDVTSHLYVAFFSVIKLIKNNILPVFVFDHKPNKLKNITIKKRKKRIDDAVNKINILKQKKTSNKIKKVIQKLEIQTFDINYKMEIDLIKLLDLMGIPHIKATGEADSLLAYMNINHYIDGVISEDTDISIFGANNLYKNVFPSMRNKKYILQHISYKNILKELNWTRDQLIELAVLLGSDYAPKINKLGMVKITELLNKGFSLEDIMEQYHVNNQNKLQILQAKHFFLNESFNMPESTMSIEIKNKLNNLKYGPVHPNQLCDFLIRDNQLSKEKIMKQIPFLKNSVKKLSSKYS